MDRYRTIAKAIKEIKKLDPDSSLTGNMIKSMVKDDLVSYTTIGNKTLVNLDSLIGHLNGDKITPRIIHLTA